VRRHIFRRPGVTCIDTHIPKSEDRPSPEVHRVENSEGVDL
jgi:hypothetical protein